MKLLPEDWFCWLEILSGDEADVLFAEDGENSYAGGMDKLLENYGFNKEDILKVKIWWSSYPKNYYVDKGRVDPKRKVIQNDDHDTQYADYRGLFESGKGCVLVLGCQPDKHRDYEVRLFENPYDVNNNAVDAPIRMILSSFYTLYNGKRMINVKKIVYQNLKDIKKMVKHIQEKDLQEFIEMKEL